MLGSRYSYCRGGCCRYAVTGGNFCRDCDPERGSAVEVDPDEPVGMEVTRVYADEADPNKSHNVRFD